MGRALLIAVVGACVSQQTPGVLPTSSHACAPFVDPLRDRQAVTDSDARDAWREYAKAHACACTPPRDERACGSFPCAPGGCYVAQCRMDADCKLGVCSDHASGPHGYCVVEDPY